MYCVQCGKQLPDGTAYCPECGKATARGQQTGGYTNTNTSYTSGTTYSEGNYNPYSEGQNANNYTPPNQPFVTVNNFGPGAGASPYNRWVALVICFFMGYLGIHRFYVGKVGTGVLYLLTLGCLGFGVLVDLITIAVGSFTDGQGRRLEG